MTAPLDAYDKILLRALQADATLSQQRLGQMANLSTAAVNRRLKALQQTGVIEKHSIVVNPKAVGCGLTVMVEVQVADERMDLLDDMQRQFQRCEHVQQCYYIAGGAAIFCRNRLMGKPCECFPVFRPIIGTLFNKIGVFSEKQTGCILYDVMHTPLNED